jgi:flagellar basal-body rod protein FlgG
MPLDAITVASRIMADDLFRLNVVTQNLANVSTSAYKRELVVARPFLDYLQVDQLRVPVGIPVLTSVLDTRPGALTQTSRALDVALEGAGFFEVAGTDGPLYTRMGSFRLDDTGRLITAAGLPVNGIGGEILLNGDSPRIDRQGRIFEGDNAVAQLKVVRFARNAALTPLGGGLYRATAPGEVVTDALQIRQGFIESSNVQALSEMLHIIELVRRFESAQRVMQNYDGMLGGTIQKLGEF